MKRLVELLVPGRPTLLRTLLGELTRIVDCDYAARSYRRRANGSQRKRIPKDPFRLVFLGKEFVVRQAVRTMIDRGWVTAKGRGPELTLVLVEDLAFLNIPDHREGGSMKKSKPPGKEERGVIKTVKVSDIIVGERCRKDLGDIAALAQSIEERGLINPISVWPDLSLAAGERRLAAVKKLGWTHVEVHVLGTTDDLFARLAVERAENTHRKNFTPSEAVTLARKLREAARKEAKDRQKKGGRAGGKASGKLPEASTGQARDQVGEAIGMGGRTYEKAKAVVEPAEADPGLANVVAEMDRTGKVDPAYQKVKNKQPEPETNPDQDGEGDLRRHLSDYTRTIKGWCDTLIRIHPLLRARFASQNRRFVKRLREVCVRLVDLAYEDF
jgi:ParB-like chromosome segregation protein Spo0J